MLCGVSFNMISALHHCTNRRTLWGRSMISLGEMISYLPVPGGHITLAERFVDPAWSLTLGWNYCELPCEHVEENSILIGRRVQLDDHSSRRAQRWGCPHRLLVGTQSTIPTVRALLTRPIGQRK